jgi:hypothetical protein
MNNTTILTIAFLLAGTLFTATMTMAPAYAGGDGDGNKQKVEDESAGPFADCDTNDAKSIYICSAISPVCRPNAVCMFGQMDPTLTALPISWR